MPYVGEIRMFGGNFAPVGWMLCQGQTLPISEYETLFNLIGTTYGGDGQETFNLPNLQGRLPVHQGRGPNISQTYVIGQPFGVESVTLTSQQMPQHTHSFMASTGLGVSANPEGSILAQPSDIRMYLRDGPGNPLPAPMVQPRGGSQPHENRMPVLVINYIVSLFGVYPSQ
jgi:microcystin-dependent protein